MQIFEQVLSELEPLCLAEQDFISKFFKLQQHPAVIPPLAQVNLKLFMYQIYNNYRSSMYKVCIKRKLHKWKTK